MSKHHKTLWSDSRFYSKMDLSVSIHLRFLCVVNIIFTFFGIISNTLVIASFWKSSQLRKKLSHFMIMVLSFFDLLSVITNHSGLLLYLIFWFREDYELLPKIRIYAHFVTVFLACSFHALFVTSIERYLGTHYPIFHRTSVTRRKLLALVVILFTLTNVTYLVSRNVFAMSATLFLIIFMSLCIPPFMFVNLKLLFIVHKVHRQRKASPEKKTTVNSKNISAGLWVVACFLLLYIPTSFRVAVNLADESANKHFKIRFHVANHICRHQLHIEQFDLFLEEQSFAHRRNKDTKDVKRSSCMQSWTIDKDSISSYFASQ